MRVLLFAVPVACLWLGGCAVNEVTQGERIGSAAGISATSMPVDPDRYYAPDGFFGYPWDTPFTDIPNLELLPDGVALVAGYRGKARDIRIENCIPAAEAAGPCRIYQHVQGAGSYVMASYFRSFEPYNPYPGAQLAAAIYYFCARTNGDFVSQHVREHLRLCGGDAIFQSDAPEVRNGDSSDTNYERVVDALIAQYGRPDNFEYSGYVTVEDEFEWEALPREKSYDPLYWCKITDRALDPPCKATITLNFDDETDTGRVLFATDAVYRFADALHETSEYKVPLYERLHGHPPDRFKSKRRVCTGTRLCGGGSRQLTERELAAFQPIPEG